MRQIYKRRKNSARLPGGREEAFYYDQRAFEVVEQLIDLIEDLVGD